MPLDDPSDLETENVPPQGTAVLVVLIHGIRGSYPDQTIKILYSLDASDWKGDSIVGEAESFSEEGSIPQIKHEQKHFLPLDPESRSKLFLKLIQEPFKFQVEGLHESGGRFEVSGKDLIFPPEFDPYEDRPFPGPFVTGWYLINPADPDVGEGFPQNIEVQTSIYLSENICSDRDSEYTNVITITVKEMHRLPKTWMLAADDDGADSIYAEVASYSLPGAAGMTLVQTPPGIMIPKRRIDDPEAAAASENPSGPTPPATEPDEFEVQHTGRKVTRAAEEAGQRVRWEHAHSVFCFEASARVFTEAVRRRTRFAVEVRRTLRDGADYVYAGKYHGLAEFDLSEFMVEGTTAVTVRSPVGPHGDFAPPSEDDLAACPPPGGQAEPEELLHNGRPANPYLLAETYLVIRVETLRPLFPRPAPPPGPLPSVRDVLPARPPVRKRVPCTDGLDHFTARVREIALEIAREYEQGPSPGAAGPGCSDAPAEDRVAGLVRALKGSGQYHDFRARLKAAVLQIIREQPFPVGPRPSPPSHARHPGPSQPLWPGARARCPGPVSGQARLKGGTPESRPLKSSPLAAASSAGVHIVSRCSSPVVWKPPVAQMSPP